MHWKKNFNWGPAIFLTSYQVLLIVFLPFFCYYLPPSLVLTSISVLLYFITGMSITGGYHRCFAHKAFKANPVLEFFFLFFGSMAMQGSALRWSFEHRNHHAFVDTEKDPYSIKKGFWYAHFFWIYEKPKPIDPKVVPDLLRNKMVMLQHNYFVFFTFFNNALAVAFVGWLIEDYVAAMFYAGWLRIFALHHSTWFINSLAHTWGDKPFCQEQTAVNNFIIAFLTFGEGYHNFHHTFAHDYRNGIKWYHYDPTKWCIWLLSKLGVASSLKVVDIATIRRKMVMERENLLLQKISALCYLKKEELEKTIRLLANRLVTNTSEFNKLKEKYRKIKSSYDKKESINEIKNEIKNIRKSLKHDWKSWSDMSKTILKMKPIKLYT